MLLDVLRRAGRIEKMEEQGQHSLGMAEVHTFRGRRDGRDLVIEIYDFGEFSNPRTRIGVVILGGRPYPLVEIGSTIDLALQRVDWEKLEVEREVQGREVVEA